MAISWGIGFTLGMSYAINTGITQGLFNIEMSRLIHSTVMDIAGVMIGISSGIMLVWLLNVENNPPIDEKKIVKRLNSMNTQFYL